MAEEKVKQTKIDELIPDDKNFNKGTEYGNSLIEKSLRKFGAGRSVLIDKNNRIIAGNKTIENASAIGLDDVIVVETDGKKIVAVKRTDIDLDSKEGRELALADNQTSAVNFSIDEDVLKDVSDELEIDLGEWGITFDEEGTAVQHNSLSDRFVVPPFSILDSRKGYWQERKRYWRNLIKDFGESRENKLSDSELMSGINNGVSLLDPVMAEIICRWFGLRGGNVFDCFAGDTVFGYVSSSLGMNFTGIELRKEQASLNNERVHGMSARYICDDGQNVARHIAKDSQDLFFSCPPYFNLEVYSDLENDASNQDCYDDFLQILRNAFSSAIECLKENRFAVIVVGDVRGDDGFYIDLVGDIKRIFINAGAQLYNELILIEPLGTLPQRVGRYMRNRKIGKCHQNVLVFYKGVPSTIPDNYPNIEFDTEEISELFA